MLHTFLAEHRTELIDRCKTKVLLRPARGARVPVLHHGIPYFLDQLIETLRIEQTPDLTAEGDRLSGAAEGVTSAGSEMGQVAALHGRELLAHGYTVDEVVHDYGDLCQAVTELAEEHSLEIGIDEFHTFNRCLDNAMADAVGEYAYARENQTEVAANAAGVRNGRFLSELRNLLRSSTLSFSILKAGRVGPGGSTGALLERSLANMVKLVEHAAEGASESPFSGGLRRRVPLAALIADIHLAAAPRAAASNCALFVGTVDYSLAIDVDRDVVFTAVMGLLTNAFKFTRDGTEVSLAARASADRILISVSDHCGGLAPGVEGKMFLPFTRFGDGPPGTGLGLSTSRIAIEANRGTLSVHDVPGKGCVFTIDLPRMLSPAVAPAAMY